MSGPASADVDVGSEADPAVGVASVSRIVRAPARVGQPTVAGNRDTEWVS